MKRYVIGQGDTAPITETLRDKDGLPVDLTGCTVEIVYWVPDTSVAFTGAATIIDADSGAVQFQPSAGDTDKSGVYVVEWVTTRTVGGEKQTYPVDDVYLLRIKPKAPAEIQVAAGLPTTQAGAVIARIRGHLADSQRLIYDDDWELVQPCINEFYAFADVAGLATTYDLAPITTDPLKTTVALTGRQQELWSLSVAVELLRQEALQAARITASLRSPAGQMNMTKLYEAMNSAYDNLAARLEERMNGGRLAGLAFVNTTPLETKRVTLPDGSVVTVGTPAA
jgi:hypothetical protein